MRLSSARLGGLVDGWYQARNRLATRHELIWGDYFALEAALALGERLATLLCNRARDQPLMPQATCLAIVKNVTTYTNF